MDNQPLRRKFKKNILSALEFTRSYIIARPFYSGIGHILVFHRVCPEREINRDLGYAGLSITPEYLESIINFFSIRGYEFISLDKLFYILSSRKIDKKFVAFTFDDGYADNFIHAYPVFRKYNIPFAIYVTTGFPDRTAILWWYLLDELILGKDHIVFEIKNRKFEFDCFTREQKKSSLLKISSLIMRSNEDDYLHKIERILGVHNIDIYSKTEQLALSWEQISQLCTDPIVTIGAHTVNHYMLSKLFEAAARREIYESKKIIELHINREVRHFSYPFGSRGQAGKREFEIAKKCGFKTATTTRNANIFFGHRHHLECLPRVDIGTDAKERELIFLINGLTHCINNSLKTVVTK